MDSPHAPPRRRAALESAALLATGGVLLFSKGVVHAPGPVALTLAVAAVTTLARALSAGRPGPYELASLAASSARAAAALLLCEQWASEAREVWGAAVIAVVWSDAASGASPRRPLLPLAIALVWAIGWSALRPSDAVPRVTAVAAIAAFGVERFSRGAQRASPDDNS
jgi:hypothetical protein